MDIIAKRSTTVFASLVRGFMKELGYTHKKIVPQCSLDLDPATAADLTENLVLKVVYMMHTLSVEPSRVFNLDETFCKILPLSEQAWTKGHLKADSHSNSNCQLGQERALEGSDHLFGTDATRHRERLPNPPGHGQFNEHTPKKPFIVIVDAAHCHVSAEYCAEV
eukprot:1397456-Amphidinium_carterae.2